MGKGSSGSNKIQEKGNTRLSPAKRWCFTLNNYSDSDYNDILAICLDGSIVSKYIVGKEVGESGTPHLQGFVYFVKKHRPKEIFKNEKIHWEKSKGSDDDNADYCSKDGNYRSNMKVRKPLKILKEDQLFSWQKDIVEIIKSEPDDRTIYWFWEPVGGIGKTTFCKYLAHVHGAVAIEGRKNDILYCAAEFESDIYIFDFERSCEDYISYAAMEKVKNGFFMCSKYESKPIVRNCPHVICFANFEPDISQLSADRWKIKKIAKTR